MVKSAGWFNSNLEHIKKIMHYFKLLNDIRVYISMSENVGNRDYSKAKVYKIVDNTNGNIYIGSTLKPLSRWLVFH